MRSNLAVEKNDPVKKPAVLPGCRYCGTENLMKDRSLWRDWKIVVWLSFSPEPQAVAGAVVCPKCMGFVGSNTRQRYFFTRIKTGPPVSEQIQKFEDLVTSQLQADGYSFKVYLEELEAKPAVAPVSIDRAIEQLVIEDVIPGFRDRLVGAEGQYVTFLRVLRGECKYDPGFFERAED